MKTIYKLAILLYFLINIVITNGQPLQKGAVMPPIIFNELVNYNAGTLNIGTLNKKLVILDFWSTGCMGCIQAFPKIDSLQKKWGKDIQIIMVNTQSADSTRRFFKKRSKIKIPAVPFITGDTLLQKMFRPLGLPMHVWLDQNLRFLSVTHGNVTTDATIARYLRDKRVDLPTYESGWVRGNSLIDSTCYPNLRQFSYLGLYKKGYAYFYDSVTMGRIDLIEISYASVEQLYIHAYAEIEGEDFKEPGRTVVEVADRYRVCLAPNDEKLWEWEQKYAYAYTLVIPKEKAARKFEFMQQDLNRYFPIRAVVEKRKHKVIALVQTGSMDMLHTKGGKVNWSLTRSSEYGDVRDSLRCLQQVKFNEFPRRLKGFMREKYGLPFVNTIRADFFIDICLPGEAVESLALPELNKALKKYGMKLVEKEMLLPTLVLKDAPQ